MKTYLTHIQRGDTGDITDDRLSNHGLVELHLRCDVGHVHWVVIIVGDVQGILRKTKILLYNTV